MTRKRKVLLAAADSDLKELLDRLSTEMDDFDFDFDTAPILNAGALNGRAVNSAAIIVEIDVSRAAAVDEFAALTRALPQPRIIAAARAAGSEDVRRLFRAGAADVVTTPFTAQAVRAALLDVMRSPGAPDGAGGAVITTIKAGGGAGATTVTLNLARRLSQPDPKRAAAATAAVLDLDLQLGDTSTALNFEPRSNVLDVLRGAARFDASFLQGVLSERAGLRLLAPAPGLIPLDAMSRELALDIVGQAARLHDFTLVDMPGAWTDWTAPVLQRSDLVVLVATATVSSVLRARRILEALAEAQVHTPVFLVLNRLQGPLESADKPPRIERSLNLKLGAKLAFDPAALRAADRGELVVDAFPSARVSRDFHTAAGALKRQLAEARSRIPTPTATLAGEAA